MIWNGAGFAGPFGLTPELFGVSAVVIADVTDDARVDIVCAFDTDVFVFRGDGRGGFAAGEIEASLVGAIGAAAVADVDSDGLPDIVASDGRLSFVPGVLGDFGDAVQDPGNIANNALALLDVNLDARLDAVVAAAGGARVLRGDGSGAFPATDDVVLPFPVAHLVAADFNRDGHPDVVAAGDGVALLLGDGDRTFTTAELDDVPLGAHATAVADLDRDGDPDLAIAHEDGVVLRFSQGDLRTDAVFSAPAQVQVSAGGGQAVDVGDFTADGDDELLWGGELFTVVVGDGAGGFSSPADFDNRGGTLADLAVGDLEGDGDLDAVAANGSGNKVARYVGNDSGGFSPEDAVDFGQIVGNVTLADLNRDGRLDVVASLITADANNGRLGLAIQTAPGTFGAPHFSQDLGGRPFYVTTTDIDGDGRLDIAVANEDTQSVDFFSFDAITEVPLPLVSVDTGSGTSPMGIAAADVDEDGTVDVVVSDRNGGVVVLRQLLLLEFEAVHFAIGSCGDGTGVAIGDVNRDHFLDLVVTCGASAEVRLAFGDGTGDFSNDTGFAAETNVQDPVLTDLDHDGDLDIVAAVFGTNHALVAKQEQ